MGEDVHKGVSMLTRLFAYVRGLARRRKIAAELEEELRFHVEQATEDHASRGIPVAEARWMALRDLGGLTQTREAVQDVRRLWLDGLFHDLRHALRRLRHEPGFAAAAILILTIGIGACTFSVVQAVLLRPYDIDAPQRLVVMWPVLHNSVGEFAYNAKRDMLRPLHSLHDAALVGSVNWSGTLTIAGGEPVTLPCAMVSATFFDVLRARSLVGRTFRAEDDEPGSARVLVLSHAAWTQHFGADPRVIGRMLIVLEEAPAEPFEIVGVMPAEFMFPRRSTVLDTGGSTAREYCASPGRVG